MLGNGMDGIHFDVGPMNLIGGTTPGAANVISANGRHGILFTSPASGGTLVQGNAIGTDLSGTLALGNAGHGIQLEGNVGEVVIGASRNSDAPADFGNVIAHNGGAGVNVLGGHAFGNTIRGNSIHSNLGLGIDLGGDGLTTNDDGDPTAVPPIPPDLDLGPNELQNAPNLTSVVFGSTTRVAGQLRSTPNRTFIVDFYANTTADSSGYGEGGRWLGSVAVTTNSLGVAGFSTEVANAVVDEFITATATNANFSTSEFSNARIVRGRPAPPQGKPPKAPADEPFLTSSSALLLQSNDAEFSLNSNSHSSDLHAISTFQTKKAVQSAVSRDEKTEFESQGGEMIQTVVAQPAQDEVPTDLLFADFDRLLGEELLMA
jgi:hypothetical protein